MQITPKMNSPEAMATQISCLSTLEHRTAFLYKKLAEKTENPLARSLLLSIAIDSSKHSALLKGIGDSIAVTEVKTKDCAKNLGQIWQMVDTCVNEVTRKENALSFADLDEKLIALESSMGEEYYIFVQMETLEHMVKEINQRYNINLDDVKGTFENIMAEENRHREIITKLKELIEPEEKDLDNTPLVKYQSPDQWIDYSPH